MEPKAIGRPAVEDSLCGSYPTSLSRDLADLSQAVQNVAKNQERLETRLDVMFTSSPYSESRVNAVLTSILDCLKQSPERGKANANALRGSPSTRASFENTPRSNCPDSPRFELNRSKPKFHEAKPFQSPQKEGIAEFPVVEMEEDRDDGCGVIMNERCNSRDASACLSGVHLQEKAHMPTLIDPVAAEPERLRRVEEDEKAPSQRGTISWQVELESGSSQVQGAGDNLDQRKSSLREEVTRASGAKRSVAPTRSSHAVVTAASESEKRMVSAQILEDMNALKKQKGTLQERTLKSMGLALSRPGGEGDQSTFLSRIMLHPAFDPLCAFVIMGNSLLLGIITEWLTVHETEASWMTIVSNLCNLFFLGELLMRMAFQKMMYFISEDKLWNLFDFTLVLFSFIDFLMQYIIEESSSTVGSTLKIIKMLRIIRIFRVFRFFRELALLALMIADSIRSLLWALVTLFIIMYVFAIGFTASATHYLNELADAAPHQEVDWETYSKISRRFGTMSRAINSLTLSMLNGVSWGQISEPLFSIGPLSGALFFFYIFFTMLAVLNIITGVFVDNAVETAKSQREFLVQKEMELKEKYLEEMRDLFHSMDKDGSGSLTIEEIHNHFSDVRVRSYFKVLGMDPDDIERLFRLIDQDASGEVEVQEFLDGCLRLKGEARSIDLHTVMYDCKACLKEMSLMSAYLLNSMSPEQATSLRLTAPGRKSRDPNFCTRSSSGAPEHTLLHHRGRSVAAKVTEVKANPWDHGF